jgi:flagellar capping protein FliD
MKVEGADDKEEISMTEYRLQNWILSILLLGWLGYLNINYLNFKDEVYKRAINTRETKTRIEYVAKTVETMKTDFKDMNKTIGNIEKAITRLDTTLKDKK